MRPVFAAARRQSADHTIDKLYFNHMTRLAPVASPRPAPPSSALINVIQIIFKYLVNAISSSAVVA